MKFTNKELERNLQYYEQLKKQKSSDDRPEAEIYPAATTHRNDPPEGETPPRQK